METPLYTPDDDLVRKVKRQQAMDASAQADAEQQRQQAQTLSDAALRTAARGNTQSTGGDGLLPGGAAVGAAAGEPGADDPPVPARCRLACGWICDPGRVHRSA